MKSKLRMAAIAAVVLITVPCGCISLWDQSLKRSSMPRKLSLGWFYAEGACDTFWSYQGAYAFSLNQSTIDAIERQGIAFFDDIWSEGNGPKRRYYGPQPWKETPISAADRDTGAGANLSCGRQHSWRWPNGIDEALRQPGSYYSGSGPMSLFVIPRLGLVVASASDR